MVAKWKKLLHAVITTLALLVGETLHKEQKGGGTRQAPSGPNGNQMLVPVYNEQVLKLVTGAMAYDIKIPPNNPRLHQHHVPATKASLFCHQAHHHQTSNLEEYLAVRRSPHHIPHQPNNINVIN